MPATVSLVESLGADAYVHAKLAEGGLAMVARTEGREPPRPGGEVRLRIDPEELVAFDVESGERLG